MEVGWCRRRLLRLRGLGGVVVVGVVVGFVVVGELVSR